MYEFSRTWLVWIAFLVFIGGVVYRAIWTFRLTKKDKTVLAYTRLKFGLRSIMHWIIPYNSVNMRLRPAFTLLSFAFHVCLLLVPIFTLGHVASFRESWGMSWWHLPHDLSILMTAIVIIGSVTFALRRIGDPTVRFVTSWSDFVLLAIVVAPFATGLLANFHIFNYEIIIILHMWSGAVWLAVIPFTRIVHMLFFPLTRAYMGSESGFVRNSKDW